MWSYPGFLHKIIIEAMEADGFYLIYSMKQTSIFAAAKTIALALLIFVSIFSLRAQETLTNSPSATNDAVAPSGSVSQLLRTGYQDLSTGQFAGAIEKLSAAIKLDPRNKEAYLLRGSVYAQQKDFDNADADYQAILLIDPESSVVKFDRAELKFLQKKYDESRPGFVELQHDQQVGDLAAYKVFLCDLFGGHQDLAATELAAFNPVDGNPSYYFANAAWDFVNKKPDAAQAWLKSARYIYASSPRKIKNYTATLVDLGYIPPEGPSTQ